MREIPGTFQRVLISANSSAEALQLWWAGSWLSGKEQTHANIQTDTDTTVNAIWLSQAPVEGPGPQREVGGHWRKRCINKKRKRAKGGGKARKSLNV